MKKKIMIIVLMLGLAVFFRGSFLAGSGKMAIVLPDGTRVDAAVADTMSEQVKGLSGVDALPKNTGMLFVYDEKDRYEFWMRGMLIPIDMVWLEDDVIVDITPEVPIPAMNTPWSELPTYAPKVPCNRVLELQAGMAEEHGLQPGQRVRYLSDTNG